MNKHGELMYESDPGNVLLAPEQFGQLAGTINSMEDKGTVQQEMSGRDSVKLIYAKSSYNNWIYLTVLDQAEITRSLEMTKFGISAMGLLLILLIWVVAYMISQYFTKPIEQLKRSLPVIPQVRTRNEWNISGIQLIRLSRRRLRLRV